MKRSLLSFLLLLLILHCAKTLALSKPAQSPAETPAQAPEQSRTPAPKGPADTIQVLLKAGHFLTFARLIKATHVDYQLTSQLNNSIDGITVFAPTNAAFSSLKDNVVGSLNDKQKLELVQFHILPRFLSTSDFQTLSNPVKTLAGSGNKFPLTISTSDSLVNISSGLTKTSISDTVYTDKQLAIYQIDKVLLPKELFPPAPAPAPARPKEESTDPDNAVPDKDHASGAVSSVVQSNVVVVFGAGVFVAMFFSIF